MPKLRLCWLLVLVAVPGAFAAAPPAGRRDLYGDPLPAGAVARMGTARWNPGVRGVRCMAFVPGGKLLATTGGSTLSLWDLRTGRKLRKFRESSCSWSPEFSAGFTFSPDGKRLFSGNWFRDVQLCWDVCSGKILARSPSHAGVRVLSIRTNGRVTACTTDGGDVVLWDPTSNSLRYLELGKGMADCKGLAFTTDGKHLIVVRNGRIPSIRHIDIASGKIVKSASVEPWYRMEIHANTGTVATSKPSEVHIYDPDTDQVRRILFKGKDYPDLSFTPDGRTLVAWNRNAQAAWLWNVATGRLIRRLHLDGLKQIDEQSPLLLSDDRTILASSESLSRIRLWDGLNGRPLFRVPGHVSAPRELAFSFDGKEIISHDRENVHHWNAETGQWLGHVVLRQPESKPNWPNWLFAPGGAHLAELCPDVIRLRDNRPPLPERCREHHLLPFRLATGDVVHG
jgi:WD40 repeat protein